MKIIQEAVDAVAVLNTELFEKLLEIDAEPSEYPVLWEVKSNGDSVIAIFAGIMVWNDDDDQRVYVDGVLPSLESFFRLQQEDICKTLGKLYAVEQDATSPQQA